MKWPHRHIWQEYQGSGFGRAKALRICICERVETYLFDSSKDKYVWVEGNFFEDHRSPVFIIAGTVKWYRAAVDHIHNTMGDKTQIYWLQFPMDVKNAVNAFRWPRILLAEDWYEAEIIQMSEIRRVLLTGHW